jgi:hypothetical protein
MTAPLPALALAALSLLPSTTSSASAPLLTSSSTDEDCNLNGLCDPTSHSCTCLPMWTGADCGTVNVGRALGPDGALYHRPNTSSWCAGVVYEAEAKVWHAYVAVMSLGCGLNSWQRNSVILHTFTEPGSPVTGPYLQSNDRVIMPAFSHNPKPIQAPDGTYLIYFIGCGNNMSNPIQNCSGGVTPNPTTTPPPADALTCGGGSTSMLSSASPYGPWTNTTILSPQPNPPIPFPTSIDNPSPLFSANGSVSVMFRSYTRSSAAYHSVIGIASAPSWRGPYTAPTKPIFMGLEEDPFLWRQEGSDGNFTFHALFHDMGGCSAVGCHAYSRDGLAWTLSSTPAYNYTVSFTDGSSTTFSRRERPQLVFDPATGAPTHLINGVQLPKSEQPKGGQDDATYSIIVPLGGA